MTSARFNARKRWQEEEMRIFDALPSALREVITKAHNSVRASSVRDALLRGVSEEAIIATLTKDKK